MLCQNKKERALLIYKEIERGIEHAEMETNIYFELPDYVEVDGEKIYKRDLELGCIKKVKKSSKINQLTTLTIACGIGCALTILLESFMGLSLVVKYSFALGYIVGLLICNHNIYYQTLWSKR